MVAQFKGTNGNSNEATIHAKYGKS